MTFYDFINNWVWCLFKTCLAVYPLYVQWNDKRRYWNDTPLLMYITFHVIFCIGLTIWLGGLGLSFISYSYRDYTQMESSQKIISSADLLTCLHTFPSFSLSPFLLSSPPPSLPFNPSPPKKKIKSFLGQVFKCGHMEPVVGQLVSLLLKRWFCVVLALLDPMCVLLLRGAPGNSTAVA